MVGGHGGHRQRIARIVCRQEPVQKRQREHFVAVVPFFSAPEHFLKSPSGLAEIVHPGGDKQRIPEAGQFQLLLQIGHTLA